MVSFSHHHQIQMLCRHLPTPESQFPKHLVRNPVSSSSRVSIVRFRDSSGRFLPRSHPHQSAHDESADSPRMQNEPGSSSAFLPGDREEARRDVYAEPPQEMRDKLQITREQVLKLETAVYGLRNAPRAWWKRVVRDLTETGWFQHQLDQCTFMFMNGTELLGLIGVCVDDFLVFGCDDDPVFSAALWKLKGTFQWRTWWLSFATAKNCGSIGIDFFWPPPFSSRH